VSSLEKEVVGSGCVRGDMMVCFLVSMFAVVELMCVFVRVFFCLGF
jgi:hypothetical protein